ncbi:MAG: dTMP kinase [Bacteriovoracaceae bacterium]|jgi:dTMP kinase|nr:dTMP kinase [Bacteriovoracaceae bacterium]
MNTIHKDSYLLSFEGIEGSGKSTQIKNLKDYLENLGFTVSILREPGGTNFGEGLRSAILNSQTKLHPMAEALLFASSRSQLLFEKVLPLLNESKNIVILDRFIDSSMAYQGFARELGPKYIEQLHATGLLSTKPVATFYLKIDIKTSMQRQSIRGNEKDYFEKEKESFYQKLIDGYNYCADNFDRVKIIDGKQNQKEVFENIKSHMDEILNA